MTRKLRQRIRRALSLALVGARAVLVLVFLGPGIAVSIHQRGRPALP